MRRLDPTSEIVNELERALTETYESAVEAALAVSDLIDVFEAGAATWSEAEAVGLRETVERHLKTLVAILRRVETIESRPADLD